MRQPNTVVSWESWRRIVAIGKAASRDESRPVLCCVHFECSDGALDVVASDSYRMATYQTEGAGEWKLSVLAAELASTVKTWTPLVKGVAEPTVKLWPKKASLTATLTGGWSATFEHVEGQHPFPAEWRDSVTEPGPLRPPSSFSKVNRQGIVDYLRSQGHGRYKVENSRAFLLEQVAALYGTAPDTKVAFNPKYFDALVASADLSPGAEVRVSLHGALRPIHLTARSRPEWHGVLMPVRA